MDSYTHSIQIDPEQLVDHRPALPIQPCEHKDPANCRRCWSDYPQSHFPNWTREQQKRSRIFKVLEKKKNETCTIHYVDVNDKGEFAVSDKVTVSSKDEDAHWQFMMKPVRPFNRPCTTNVLNYTQRPEGTRLRAMFIENLSGPMLQMLGTKLVLLTSFRSQRCSQSLLDTTSNHSISLLQSDGYLQDTKRESNEVTMIVRIASFSLLLTSAPYRYHYLPHFCTDHARPYDCFSQSKFYYKYFEPTGTTQSRSSHWHASALSHPVKLVAVSFHVQQIISAQSTIRRPHPPPWPPFTSHGALTQ